MKKNKRKKKKMNSKNILIIVVAVIAAILIMFGTVYILFGNEIFKSKNSKQENKEDIIPINEWAEISKYNEKTKQNENVKVRITKITIGADAEAIVRSYAENTKFIDYDGVYEGMSLVVAEYEIDFGSYTKNKYGEDVKIDAEVLSKAGTIVETEDTIYDSLPIKNISSEDKISQDKIGVGYFEFQIPLNHEDIALKLGNKEGTTRLFSIN